MDELNPKDEPILKTVCASFISKGGAGKTFAAQMIDAIAKASGHSTSLGSNDETNKALSALLGGGVAEIGWDTDYSKARHIVNNLRAYDIGIFDVGANSSSGSDKIFHVFEGFRDGLEPLGAKLVVMVPSDTNKGGGLHTALKTVDLLMSEGFEVVLLLNDRDGSGNFGTEAIPKGIPTGVVGHLAPGLQSYRQMTTGSLYEAMTIPQEGYNLATERLANFVLTAGQSDWMRKVFWWDGALTSLPEASSVPPLKWTLHSLASVTDEALEGNIEFADAFREFENSPINNAEFMMRATRLHAAMNAK